MSTPEPPARRRLVVSFDDDPALAAPPSSAPAPAPPVGGLPPVPPSGPPLVVGAAPTPHTAPPLGPPAYGGGGGPTPGAPGGHGSGLPLGSRGARLLSRIIDGVILIPVSLLFFFLATFAFAGILSAGTQSCAIDEYGMYSCDSGGALAAGLGGILAVFLIILIGNAVALAILGALAVRAGIRNGQTVGRQVLDLRLVRVDRQPITWATALKREALFPFLLALPFYLGTLVDLAYPLIDARKRRLVDVFCGTEVVVATGTEPLVPPAMAP